MKIYHTISPLHRNQITYTIKLYIYIYIYTKDYINLEKKKNPVYFIIFIYLIRVLLWFSYNYKVKWQSHNFLTPFFSINSLI